METIYVNLKSELTQQMDAATAQGFETYRTRTRCQCRYPSNRRNAVLCVKGGELVRVIIKCKGCSTQKKGGAL